MPNRINYIDGEKQEKRVRRANLIIEGNTGNYNWETIKGNWYLPKSGTSSNSGISVALKNDGKIIICAMVENDVYEGTINNDDKLISMNETVYDWKPTGIVTNNYGRCFVSRADNILWLTVLEVGSTSTNATYKIYRSVGGNGGDWELHSTLFDHIGTGYDWYVNSETTAGAITMLPNGRYVLCGTYISNGTWHAAYPNIWTSDDRGTTWTHRFRGEVGPSVHAYFAGTFAKDIAIYGDVLFYNFSYNYGGAGTRVYKSLNWGLTWSFAFEVGGGGYPIGGTMYTDPAGNLLMLHTYYSSNRLVIRKFLNPLSGNSSLVMKDFTGKTERHNHLVSVNDKILIISGAYILGFKFEEFKRLRKLHYKQKNTNWGGVSL